MNCRTVRRYLAMYLDSELGPETTFEISSHLEECDNCRRVAEQEGHLEDRLRKLLRAPRPEDEAVWKRSVAHMGRSRPGPRTPVIMFGIAGLAAAATIALFVLLGAPWDYDELDLAEVTAAEHAQVLTNGDLTSGEARTASELSSFFQTELSPAYCLNIDTSAGTKVIGADICELSNVRTAHVAWADSQTIVSMFWFPNEAIAVFPETIKRFEEHGSSFHCRVDQYEFFAKRAGAGIIVGVAQTTPAKLQVYVEGAAMGACTGEG